MRPDTLLEDTLRGWADEARVPHDLADRALRGRVRRRSLRAVLITGAGVAIATVTAAAVVMSTVPRLVTVATLPRTAAPTSGMLITPGPTEAADTAVHTDTGNSPPRSFIAAGHVAVSAYYVDSLDKISDDRTHYRRTWYLYDPSSGTYKRTDWSMLDVAPGLKYAAVLERDLPARRVGIVDMATQRVVKWFDLGDHPVAGLAWSPDGTRLVATAYDQDPDIRDKKGFDSLGVHSRTGFHLVDVATGRTQFHAVAEKPVVVHLVEGRPGTFSTQKGEHKRPFPRVTERPYPSQRHDFGWSDDGTLLWEHMVTDQNRRFLDLEGKEHAVPEDWKRAVRSWQQAGVSPNGRLYADGGRPPGPQTIVRKTATGKIVGVQGMEQLLAWADDDHLIGVRCAGECENEFNNGLALVSLDGKSVTQLSANRANTQRLGSWVPLLTRR